MKKIDHVIHHNGCLWYRSDAVWGALCMAFGLGILIGGIAVILVWSLYT